jgi:hypothetical protein
MWKYIQLVIQYRKLAALGVDLVLAGVKAGRDGKLDSEEKNDLALEFHLWLDALSKATDD